MRLDLDSRLTIAFIAGIVGLFWQGIIATAGGVPSEALITAFSSVLLATIGIGIKNDNENKKDNK